MPELDITERLRLLPILPVREIRSEARDICRDAIHEITLLREREMLRDRGEPEPDHAVAVG